MNEADTELIHHYFSDDSLIRAVARERMKSCEKRHEAHLYYDINHSERHPQNCGIPEVDRMTPPRKLWSRARKEFREKVPHAFRRERALYQRIRLEITAGRLLQQEWGQRLDAFIRRVQHQIMDEGFSFSSPRVFPLGKPDGDCRAISRYENLDERIMQNRISAYLRDRLDEQLGDSVYAFRKHREGNPMDQHAAFRRLKDRLGEQNGAGLHVAEIDLRGFFDMVSHAQVRRSFYAAVHEAERRGRPIASSALRMVERLLESYSFFDTAVPAVEQKLKEDGRGRKLKRVSDDELRQLGVYSQRHELGLPQGSPLSVILSNFALSAVDRAVEEGGPADLLYVRFCDDILLAHPDRSVCEGALDRCCRSLNALALPFHAPAELKDYDREYYRRKSKAVFHFADSDRHTNAIPWVGLLGYQLRFDGATRVRKGSLEREMSKQARVVNRMLGLIPQPMLLDQNKRLRIYSRLRGRLSASAVGRSGESCTAPEPDAGQPCWIEGFRELGSDGCSRSQLRQLDRHRERLLARARRHLFTADELKNFSSLLQKGSRRPHLGAPFSYHSLLHQDRQRPSYMRRTRDSDYQW